jgi:hypothetical protein
MIGKALYDKTNTPENVGKRKTKPTGAKLAHGEFIRTSLGPMSLKHLLTRSKQIRTLKERVSAAKTSS